MLTHGTSYRVLNIKSDSAGRHSQRSVSRHAVLRCQPVHTIPIICMNLVEYIVMLQLYRPCCSTSSLPTTHDHPGEYLMSIG